MMLSIWIFFFSFSGIVSADPAPVVQEVNVIADMDVSDTVWSGTDSSGTYFEYYFNRTGTLHYLRLYSGLEKGGYWEQIHNRIYMALY